MRRKEVEERGRKKKKEKRKKGEDNESKESGWEIEDLGWGRRGCKIRGESKKLVLKKFHK